MFKTSIPRFFHINRLDYNAYSLLKMNFGRWNQNFILRIYFNLRKHQSYQLINPFIHQSISLTINLPINQSKSSDEHFHINWHFFSNYVPVKNSDLYEFPFQDHQIWKLHYELWPFLIFPIQNSMDLRTKATSIISLSYSHPTLILVKYHAEDV